MPETIIGNPYSLIGGNPLYQATGTTQMLQSTLSSSTSGIPNPPGVGHHPITCTSDLTFDDEGLFACEHYECPADDARTRACLIHSVALLIIEEAMKL